MTQAYVGIDFGTSNLKVAAYSINGRELTCLRTPTPLDCDSYGETVYLPSRVEQIIKEKLAELQTKYQLVGIAITGMSEAGLVLCRSNMQPLSSIIPWFDLRTTELAKKYQSQDATAFVKTGLRNSAKYGIYKYLWLLDKLGIDCGETIWLSACDYICWLLTGRCVTDPTFAARTYLYNISTNDWDDERLEQFAIARHNLPEVLPSGSLAGWLHSGLVVDKNLSVPVVIAGHDHLCAGYMAFRQQPDSICNSMGTAETLVSTRRAAPLTSCDYDTGLVYGPFVVPGLQFCMANLPSSGLSIEWMRKVVHPNEIDYNTLELVLDKLADLPTDLLYFPFLTGMGTPHYLPNAAGAIMGLHAETDWRQLLKCTVEGISLHSRYLLSIMPDCTGVEPLFVMGGAARSPAWMQLKSTILQRTIYCPAITEGTLLGAVQLMCDNLQLPFAWDYRNSTIYRPSMHTGDCYSAQYRQYVKLLNIFTDRNEDLP